MRTEVLEAPPASGSAWMITFADLTALMLTFFVLLFSMSEPEPEKWEAIVDSLSVRLAPVRSSASISVSAPLTLEQFTISRATDIDYLHAVIVDKVGADLALAGSVIGRTEDRLTLSLPADSLFERGSAVLTPTARGAAFVLGGILSPLNNRVEVFGHTDPTPATSAVVSDWELSLARAEAMASALRGYGYPHEIGAFGRGAGRFDDINPALPSQRRRELARRVDVVVRQEAVNEAR